MKAIVLVCLALVAVIAASFLVFTPKPTSSIQGGSQTLVGTMNGSGSLPVSGVVMVSTTGGRLQGSINQ